MLKWQYVFNLNTDNYIKLNFSDLKKKMLMILVAAPRSFKIGFNKFCHPGRTSPMFTCMLQCCVASTVLALKLFASVAESTDGMRPTDLPFW